MSLDRVIVHSSLSWHAVAKRGAMLYYTEYSILLTVSTLWAMLLMATLYHAHSPLPYDDLVHNGSTAVHTCMHTLVLSDQYSDMMTCLLSTCPRADCDNTADPGMLVY